MKEISKRAWRRSPGERARLIVLFRQGELTLREFSRKHGINPGTFGQWLYRRKRRTLPLVPSFQEVVLPRGISSVWAAEISVGSRMTVRLDKETASILVNHLVQSAQTAGSSC